MNARRVVAVSNTILVRLATALLTILAVMQPVAAAEQPVSRVTYGLDVVTPQHPLGIASDGRAFETVWSDNTSLYATHSDASGEPISQLRLGASPPGQYAAIGWSGTAYVIVWFDNAGRTIVATVDRNGDLVTSPHNVVIGAPRNTMQPIAWASNGRTVLIAFVDDATTIHAALLDVDGNVLRAFIAISVLIDRDEFLSTVKAVTNGSEYVLLWIASKTIPNPPYFSQTFRATEINSSGVLTKASGPLGMYTGAYSFDAAYAHGRYVVLVAEEASGMLRRFSVDAITLESTPLPDTAERYDAYLISDGNRFIAYRVRGVLQVATFTGDPNEGPLRFVNTIDTASGYRPYMTAMDAGYVVAWASNWFVLTAVLDRGFNSLRQRAVASLPVPQSSPAIAIGNDQSLVVWFEQTYPNSGGGIVRAARLTSSGAILDHEPLVVGADATTDPPAVVGIADGYFVAWLSRDRRSIRGRRVERDGSLGVEVSYGIDAMNTPPALAANATTMLLVAGTKPLDALRLNPNGRPIDAAPLVISSAAAYAPQVATNGSDFLVVWTNQIGYSPKYQPIPRDIFGARVMTTGVVDPTPIPIATTGADEYAPCIASDGRDYVVGYENVVTGASTTKVKRVLHEGQLADTTPDSPGTTVASQVTSAAITRTSDGYFVAFENSAADVLVRHLDDHGVPDSEPVTIASSTVPYQTTIALTAVGHGDFVAAYQRYFDDGHSPVVGRLMLHTPDVPRRRRAVK